jgi:Flp pilus assembly protein TadD
MTARSSFSSSQDPQGSLIARARKLRRRGETRRMLTTLREACLRDEGAAWLWTLYGAMLAANGRDDDARRALKHALWLRKNDGDDARVKSTQALIDRIVPAAA